MRITFPPLPHCVCNLPQHISCACNCKECTAITLARNALNKACEIAAKKWRKRAK